VLRLGAAVGVIAGQGGLWLDAEVRGVKGGPPLGRGMVEQSDG
jgi:hypothetical protein